MDFGATVPTFLAPHLWGAIHNPEVGTCTFYRVYWDSLAPQKNDPKDPCAGWGEAEGRGVTAPPQPLKHLSQTCKGGVSIHGRAKAQSLHLTAGPGQDCMQTACRRDGGESSLPFIKKPCD